MTDEIVETPEEKAIRMKQEYTTRLKDEYISAQLALDPNFVFDEALWADRPVWSDEVEPRYPKNVPIGNMLSIFPPGSVVPYLVAIAIIAVILLVALK
jgi:hypothetical protein